MTTQHALKIENLPQGVLSQADGISVILFDIADRLGLSERTEKLECRRRDGYFPHSWNQGGWQSFGFTTIDMMMGSGIMSGSDKLNNLVEEYYCTEMKECLNKFLEDKNLDTGKTWEDLTEAQTEELQNDYESEWFQDSDYHSVQVEYQGRYLGYENGLHTISLNIFLCASDAPYHRKSDDDIEIEITFRDIGSKNCKNKIDKAVKKMEDFIGNLELY